MSDEKPGMSPRDAERGPSRRIQIGLNVKLRILIPEETFTPIEYDCVTQDISETGMRIKVDRLTTTLYLKLLESTRYARISLANPRGGDEIKLTGKIVWLDYQSADHRSGACDIGISLGESPELSGLVAMTAHDELTHLIRQQSPGS
jgi:hypothetical protein